MIDHPQIIQTDEQLTAVIHIIVPRADIMQVMDAAIKEVLAALESQGIKPIGSLFTYHLKRPTDIFEFEVGFPVDKVVTSSGRVKASKLPAATVVRTNYHGNYEGLSAAWGGFCSWIDSNGYQAQESLWECYLIGPETSNDSPQWCTELNRPLVV